MFDIAKLLKPKDLKTNIESSISLIQNESQMKREREREREKIWYFSVLNMKNEQKVPCKMLQALLKRAKIILFFYAM